MSRVFVHQVGMRVGDLRAVERWARAVLDRSGAGAAALTIFLCDRRKMRALNRRYQGKDEPANVLSFSEPDGIPHPELGKGETYLGEVYLAPREIRRRGDNLLYLLTHGILHLLGYTHGDERDRIRMERRERELTRV